MNIPVWIFLFMVTVMCTGSLIGCATFGNSRKDLIFLSVVSAVLWVAVCLTFPYEFKECL